MPLWGRSFAYSFSFICFICSDFLLFLEQILVVCCFPRKLVILIRYSYINMQHATFILLKIPFVSVGKFKKLLLLIYIKFPP